MYLEQSQEEAVVAELLHDRYQEAHHVQEDSHLVYSGLAVVVGVEYRQRKVRPVSMLDGIDDWNRRAVDDGCPEDDEEDHLRERHVVLSDLEEESMKELFAVQVTVKYVFVQRVPVVYELLQTILIKEVE